MGVKEFFNDLHTFVASQGALVGGGLTVVLMRGAGVDNAAYYPIFVGGMSGIVIERAAGKTSLMDAVYSFGWGAAGGAVSFAAVPIARMAGNIVTTPAQIAAEML